MGNCVTTNNHNRDLSENEVEEEIKPPSNLGTKGHFGHMGEKKMMRKKKKKMVRFQLDGYGEDDELGSGNDDGGKKRKGVVRIKVVMTQEELRQMLNEISDDSSSSSSSKSSSSSSLEECLLSVIKLKGRRVSHEAVNGGVNSNWRPALESIPEDL